MESVKAAEAARLIRARLQAAQIRPRDLIRTLDVDRSTASTMLSGKRGIPAWHYEALAKLLNISVAELFTPQENVSRVTSPGTDPAVSSTQTPARHEREAYGDSSTRLSAPAHSEGVLEHLVQAAKAFRAISAEADDWYGRLIDLAADHAIDIAEHKTATHGVNRARHARRGGTSSRSHTRKAG